MLLFMHKLIRVIICLSVLICISGCSSRHSEDTIVCPPVRIGETSPLYIDFAKEYTFESAYEDSDAVLCVEIGNWLKEDEFHTYYEAKVLSCYKGDVPEKIILLQSGTSKETLIWYYPLFTYGNRLFYFYETSRWS